MHAKLPSISHNLGVMSETFLKTKLLFKPLVLFSNIYILKIAGRFTVLN